MNHRYIDEHSVAERYLEHALPPAEHDAFEAHIVQCDECSDRLLLAQIFLDHKAIGLARPASSPPQPPDSAGTAAAQPSAAKSAAATVPDAAKEAAATKEPAAAAAPNSSASHAPGTNSAQQTPPVERDWPKRAYFVAQFTPWQLFFLAVGTAALLLAVPTAFFLGQLVRLSGRH